jgi:hypothetical protein
VQKGLYHLTFQLAKGNMNPGIGTKSLGNGISYARARDGARVFSQESEIRILTKASKQNEQQVIKELTRLLKKPIKFHMTIKRISPLSSPEECNPEDDNLDVHIELSDGRVYSFVVATPKNIYKCMRNEGIDYFFGVPPVFVEKLTAENIERALTALITENNGRALLTYGVLQRHA